MSETAIEIFLARLEAAAHSASVAEDSYRKEALERVRSLERARAFAFRRLNLARSMAAAMTGSKDEAEAVSCGTAAFLREVNWNGATESQREVMERLRPVLLVIWKALEAGEADAEELDRQMESFELWFEQNRSTSLLGLMDGEVLELPLVEVA